MTRPFILSICIVPIAAIAALTFLLASGHKAKTSTPKATTGLPVQSIYACGQQQQSDGSSLIICIVQSGGCKLVAFDPTTYKPTATQAIPAKNCA